MYESCIGEETLAVAEKAVMALTVASVEKK
jgi:hypothetical protein